MQNSLQARSTNQLRDCLALHLMSPMRRGRVDDAGYCYFSLFSVPVAQWLEHCVNSAKVVGSNPREHMY